MRPVYQPNRVLLSCSYGSCSNFVGLLDVCEVNELCYQLPNRLIRWGLCFPVPTPLNHLRKVCSLFIYHHFFQINDASHLYCDKLVAKVVSDFRLYEIYGIMVCNEALSLWFPWTRFTVKVYFYAYNSRSQTLMHLCKRSSSYYPL